ncbi:hypothetical protein FNV43_RR24438 [Rhamnella rubrinervis]|uniref:Uncharacterized protein n=1 Tax=Rhamnella rubrinervis TaxID=2594499 RepID=A0A8K0DR67_9ROSA|nr:hypothetical protein FNV43_RR24438 [Rhamnella rubrinervis]
MRYLYDAAIKVEKAFKKKAEAYINAAAANKTKKTTSKQTAAGSKTSWNGGSGPRSPKAIEKDRSWKPRTRLCPNGRRVTPTHDDEEDGGQEDMEITSARMNRMKEMPSYEPTVTPLNRAIPSRGYEIAFNEESGRPNLP